MTKELKKKSEDIKFTTQAYINGKFVDSVSGKSFPSYNPATGELIANIAECDAADIENAVAAAKKAFQSGIWSKKSPKERKGILQKLAALVEDHAETLGIIESLDNGKPVADAIFADVPDAVETLRWNAEAIDKVYDLASPTARDVVSLVVREPIGVVGVVIPWNFPLPILAMKLGPVLASGNTVVIKPAEQTSLSALHFATLCEEAGIPPGVVNIVPGFGETAGKALGMHPDVDCLSFTGSTEVGRFFLHYAAESNLKKVMLELGGKSPAIVMNDVKDLQHAAEEVAMGILFSQGENCSAGSRLLIQSGIKDKFMKVLLAEFAKWTVGDPFSEGTKIGALIDEKHMKRILYYIEQGLKEGATLLTGGKQLLKETGGYFIGPTVFDNVKNDMLIAREEIFGPVLSVITFDTMEEAIEIANDTVYGLASSLHTNDLTTAHTMAREIRAGTVSVNCFSEGDQSVPFGGFKQSGFGGREKSLQIFDHYSELKTIWIQLV